MQNGGIHALDGLHHRAEAADVNNRHGRHQNERTHHHEALNNVRPRYGKEAAHQGVEHNDPGHQRHAQAVIHTEG